MHSSKQLSQSFKAAKSDTEFSGTERLFESATLALGLGLPKLESDLISFS